MATWEPHPTGRSNPWLHMESFAEKKALLQRVLELLDTVASELWGPGTTGVELVQTLWRHRYAPLFTRLGFVEEGSGSKCPLGDPAVWLRPAQDGLNSSEVLASRGKRRFSPYAKELRKHITLQREAGTASYTDAAMEMIMVNLGELLVAPILDDTNAMIAFFSCCAAKYTSS